MTSPPDSAAVAFPPPFLFAAAVVGGSLLNRPWPLPVHAGASWRIAAGILAALSLMLIFGSIGLFWQRRTSIIPNRPADALVVRGPYRFTRNPMYVGLALLTVALGVFLDSWWVMILLTPALAIVQLTVVAPEERYLRRRFGAEYETYMRTARRWI
jgi:protein-S-isoprenylcysteine O-methyltransferase Ste14